MAIPKTLDLIEQLISQPSVSSANPELDSSNLNVVHLLADWLESLGWQTEVMPVSEHKANLVATLGCIDQADGLVLSGHTDTVPFDESLWLSNPFQATEKDQRLYGLGATDMKAFFAVALSAAQGYSANQLKRPLTLVATADEESSMAGAKALLASGRSFGRYAVIGEPTDLRPISMHKGIMTEAIKISGQSGHSSDPGLGANAMEAMHRALSILLEWRSELQQQHQNTAFKVPYPTINLGSIHGGDNPNRICGACETQIDIRVLPGMQIQALRDTLHQKLALAVAGDARLSLSIESLFEGLPAFETPMQSRLLSELETLCSAPSESVAFGTEAPYFAQMGMETVIMGPGSINQAHQANEYLELEQIDPAIVTIQALIERFCVL